MVDQVRAAVRHAGTLDVVVNVVGVVAFGAIEKPSVLPTVGDSKEVLACRIPDAAPRWTSRHSIRIRPERARPSDDCQVS